jgi:response regulator RpfG family c-di-GMP phosphodiesterase
MVRSGIRSPILAVSEDPETLALIAGVLEQDKTLEVRPARSLQEGLKTAGGEAICLVILDLQAAAAGLPDPLPEAGAEGPVAPVPCLVVCETSEVPVVMPLLGRTVDDCVEKRLCAAVLLTRVRSMIGTGRLNDELRAEEERHAETTALLKKNFKEMTGLLLKILEVRIPGASDRAQDAKEMAKFVAGRLDYPDERRRMLIFAALMHEIGKIGLPDALLGKCCNSLPAVLKAAYRQYPTVGSMIVSTISGYRESAEAVYHQLENEDGSGFPDELVGDEIPINARILRAVVFQEELRMEGRTTDEIVERMRSAMHSLLDERIANLLIEFLLEHRTNVDTNKLRLRVDELKAGMVIAEDIYAASGVKLLPKGVQLQNKTLAVLAERNETDPIIGGVYILTDWGLLYGT